MRLNYKILIAMLVLAIFAVGSVSAAEVVADDVLTDSVDEIVIDDEPIDEVDDELLTTSGYDVDDSMDSDDINLEIVSASTGSGVVNFTPGTYSNMALVLQDNVALYGNGATIYGNGADNVFTVTGKSNFTITGFNIIVNSTQKAAIYGSNVVNSAITNNNITGGKDGINIFQTYSGLTITGNKITGVSRDAISLVNHKTFSTSEWNSWASSIVSGNIISGSSEYGMFFGGNFKGTISNNVISGVGIGMEFAGKKNATNGQLSAQVTGNNITGVTLGINMSHPCVKLFNLTSNTINTTSSSNFAINTTSYFAKYITGRIYVNNNVLNGLISSAFISATNSASGNSGTGAYTKP